MIRNILLCGCSYLFSNSFPIEPKGDILHYHFYINKGCDRKARIEFKKLMKKWRQQLLPKDYWENKENE